MRITSRPAAAIVVGIALSAMLVACSGAPGDTDSSNTGDDSPSSVDGSDGGPEVDVVTLTLPDGSTLELDASNTSACRTPANDTDLAPDEYWVASSVQVDDSVVTLTLTNMESVSLTHGPIDGERIEVVYLGTREGTDGRGNLAEYFTDDIDVTMDGTTVTASADLRIDPVWADLAATQGLEIVQLPGLGEGGQVQVDVVCAG